MRALLSPPGLPADLVGTSPFVVYILLGFVVVAAAAVAVAVAVAAAAAVAAAVDPASIISID